MAKTKDPMAAIKRAVDTAKELTGEDRVTVISRLETGQPAMGLTKMAYVEGIYADLGDEDKVYLLGKLKALPGAMPKSEA